MAASSIEHTFMMTLDHVGDLEAMVHAQLGQQLHVRTTETSPERSSGNLSCLSGRPPDLAFLTGTRPRVVLVLGVSTPRALGPIFQYSTKDEDRSAAARSPRSRYRRSSVLSPLRAYQPWNYPGSVPREKA